MRLPSLASKWYFAFLSGSRRPLVVTSGGAVFLAVAVLLFHRQVLFDPNMLVPWDLRTFHLPLAVAYADALREGALPLWEPFTFCGRPLLANPQAATFYPGVFWAAIFGRDGILFRLECLEVAHLFLAGFCTYLLGRRLGLDAASATLSGLVFELGGFAASQMEHLSSICGAVWLVVAWLSLLLPARWRIPVLAVALTSDFFLGFTAFTIVIGASTVLLATLLWCFDRSMACAVRDTVCAGLLAAGLAGVQLLPALELASNSVGKYRTDWLLGGGGIPPAALISFVRPNFWGIFDLRTYNAPFDPTMLYLYVSIGGLLLATGALFRRFRYRAPLVLAAAIFGVLMIGEYSPVGRLLFSALPGTLRNTVYWYPFMAPFLLTISILAGFGAQVWLRSPVWRLVACTVIAGDLIITGSGRPMNAQPVAAEPLTSEHAINGSRAALELLRTATGEGRFDTLDDSVSMVSLAPVTRLRAANDYDPLALERTIQVRLTFAHGERWGAYYQVEDATKPTLDLMSIQAITSRSPLSPARLRGSSWVWFAEAGGRAIYRNLATTPRYRLVGRVLSARNLAESVAWLRAGTAAGFRDSAVAEGFELQSDGSGKVRVVSEARNRIVLESDVTAPMFLVTSETHYPGWSALIDGQPAPVFYTNVAFRGVPLPAGEHRIELQFACPALARGCVLTAAAGIVWIFLFCRPWSYALGRGPVLAPFPPVHRRGMAGSRRLEFHRSNAAAGQPL